MMYKHSKMRHVHMYQLLQKVVKSNTYIVKNIDELLLLQDMSLQKTILAKNK